MGFFDLPRVPEPEVMDDAGEVEAYSSAAAQSHLEQIDNTFVEHAVRLAKGRERGRGLDIGTGPGQITIKLAGRLTLWKFIGIDRSPNMIDKAGENLGGAGNHLAGRVEFRVADGNHLPFPDGTFDFVMCNSVLHHLAEPIQLLDEIARVAAPGGALLIRDLRRPGRLASSFHIRWHGRHYEGTMRELFDASVHAAYTEEELQQMVRSSRLWGARVFRHESTHIGLERAASARDTSKH